MEVPESIKSHWESCTDCSKTNSLSNESLVSNSQSSPHFVYEQILTWTSLSLNFCTWNWINDKKTLQPCFLQGELLEEFLYSDSTILHVSILSFSPGWTNKQKVVMNMQITTFANTQNIFLCKLINISFSNSLFIYFEYWR